MKLRNLLPLLFFTCTSAYATQGYYRQPDIHNNTVVFTAEGDLWLYDIKAKNSKRLTTHPAEETYADISPNGKHIAFTANYEGSTEVYLLPINGGVAKRLSFENSYARVQGWTEQGNVIFSTNSRVGPTGNWTLKTVNPKTLVTQTIELADAVEGVTNDNMVYFTQFGLQVSGDNAKVYRGGALGEIWSFNQKTKQEATKLTADHEGSVRQPMVYDDRVYFISDASGNDNIWSMDTDGSNKKQHTQYKDLPVRHANIGGKSLVYQLGADIKSMSLRNHKSKTLPITLTSDLPNLRENWVNKPLNYLTSSYLAPADKKVVLTARGRVAIASIDGSRLIDVATPQNSRTRQAILSHDGQWVYALNDSSGEMELWRYAADGSNESKQLTTDGNIFRWQMSLSPDGNSIVHDDQNGDLWLLNLETLENKKILSDNAGLSQFGDLVWSADSKLLAITRNHQNDERSRILLYSVIDGKQQLLTSDKYNAFSPAFSHDQKWLYFISERHFRSSPSSPWGDRNLGAMFDRRGQLFAISLDAKAAFPFQAPNELTEKAKSKKSKSKVKPDEANKAEATGDNDSEETSVETIAPAKVDWDNIASRLWQVPVAPGNYNQLKVNKHYLYVRDRVTEPGAKPSLKSIKIGPKPKVKNYASNVAFYQLSSDGNTLFLRQAGGAKTMYVVKAGATLPKGGTDTRVQTSAWKLAIQPREEWQQLFHDAWIMHRDSLFDRNMRGLNWLEVKKKYQPLLARITDRYELNDIFAQMMGELNALHSQVRGGDVLRDLDRPTAATLGAVLQQQNQGVVIQHIYLTDPELPSEASPLNHASVDANVGDVIVAVNGRATPTIAEVNNALRNQAGKQTLLTLKRGEKSHKTIVKPTSVRRDARLRYNDWTHANRERVVSVNDDIGYLHLYAMGSGDIANFAREFYANYDKKGLIIDVRRNRGGNIDSWIIEKLLRKAWMFWQSPIGGPSTNMQQTFRGHLVVLADQYTYSDGETFTAGVKALNLAPVIGKRTAGAGVWLRGMNSLSDYGMARVAEFPQFAMDGRWIVEGYGVEPTMEVDNLPHATFNGEDAQLQAAIDYLNKQMQQQPIPELKAKPIPPANTPADDILAK